MLSEFFIEDFLITPPPPPPTKRTRVFRCYTRLARYRLPSLPNLSIGKPIFHLHRRTTNDTLFAKRRAFDRERKKKERRGGNSCPRLAWCHACKVAITRWINVWGFVCVCVRASEARRLARGANEYSRSVFERKTNTILRLHRVPFYGSRGAALINDPGHVVAASRTGGCRPFPILPRATTLPRLSLRSRNYARLESRRAQWPRCTFPIVYTITTTRWWLYRW